VQTFSMTVGRRFRPKGKSLHVLNLSQSLIFPLLFKRLMVDQTEKRWTVGRPNTSQNFSCGSATANLAATISCGFAGTPVRSTRHQMPAQGYRGAPLGRRTRRRKEAVLMCHWRRARLLESVENHIPVTVQCVGSLGGAQLPVPEMSSI
jgi:hypothetical protein